MTGECVILVALKGGGGRGGTGDERRHPATLKMVLRAPVLREASETWNKCKTKQVKPLHPTWRHPPPSHLGAWGVHDPRPTRAKAATGHGPRCPLRPLPWSPLLVQTLRLQTPRRWATGVVPWRRRHFSSRRCPAPVQHQYEAMSLVAHNMTTSAHCMVVHTGPYRTWHPVSCHVQTASLSDHLTSLHFAPSPPWLGINAVLASLNSSPSQRRPSLGAAWERTVHRRQRDFHVALTPPPAISLQIALTSLP